MMIDGGFTLERFNTPHKKERDMVEARQTTVFLESTAIRQAVAARGYGQTWEFWYIGKKDKSAQYRQATLHPPVEGGRPTLTEDYWVGYDPNAPGGWRTFRFDSMSEATPVEGYFVPD